MKHLSILILFILTMPCYALDIVIFIDQKHPVSAVPDNAQVVYLDALEHIEQTHFNNLPTIQYEAELVAKQLIQSNQQEWQQQLLDAHQGILTAWTLGINKIPAVVVNNRYVVYGQPNVLQALTTIKTVMEASNE